MRSNTIILMVLATIPLLASGCGNKEGRQVLVRIDNSKVITMADFNDRVSKLPKRYQDVINENKKTFLEEIVMDELLYREALRKKLYSDKDVQKVFNEAKKKILIARLVKDEVEDKTEVSEAEIVEYYNEDPDKFMTPEVLRASHILVKREEEANNILKELANKKDFEDLARTYSIDPAAKDGGDIGYFTKKQILPELEEASFKMQPGEISGVIKTRFGYHIIKLTEKKEPKLKDISEVRDGIKEALRRYKEKVRFNEFVKNIKDKSKVYINEKLLENTAEKTQPEK